MASKQNRLMTNDTDNVQSNIYLCTEILLMIYNNFQFPLEGGPKMRAEETSGETYEGLALL